MWKKTNHRSLPTLSAGCGCHDVRQDWNVACPLCIGIGATVYKRMCSTQLSLTNGFVRVMVKRVRLQAASDLGQWTQVQWSSSCRYLIQRKGITSDHEADAENMATSATFFRCKGAESDMNALLSFYIGFKLIWIVYGCGRDVLIIGMAQIFCLALHSLVWNELRWSCKAKWSTVMTSPDNLQQFRWLCKDRPILNTWADAPHNAATISVRPFSLL